MRQGGEKLREGVIEESGGFESSINHEDERMEET